MSKVKVNELYLGLNGNKRHNCAQAVIAGFQDELSIPDDLVAKFAAFGGGKAPEGFCGALYAACHLLGKDGAAEAEVEFAKAAGSAKCREIRSIKKLSCPGCVEKAAEIVENHLSLITIKER